MIEFGKKEANYIKTIAILMMFYHHFFGFPSWIVEGNSYIPTMIDGICLEKTIATFCKLCVGLFAFTSGYAMYIKRKQYNQLKYRLKVIVSFLLKYWFIFLFFLIIGFIFNEPLPSLKRLILQCFGITTGTGFDWKYQSTIHPMFAWYVSFYIIFVMTYPLLKKLSRNYFLIDQIALFVVLNGTYILIVNQSFITIHPVILDIISRFVIWAHVGMIGYMFAKYGLFAKISQRLNVNIFIHGICCFIIIVGLVVLRIYTGAMYKYAISYDVLYTPILIYCLLGVLKIIDCQFIEKITNSLSKHSTSMWFLHALYFTPHASFQWMAYIFKYPIIIFIMTVITMYLLSIIIDFIYSFVLNKVVEMGKTLYK